MTDESSSLGPINASVILPDKDLSWRPPLGDQIRTTYASFAPAISDISFNLWRTTSPALTSTRLSLYNENPAKSDILCKYYRCTQTRRSYYCTLGGRISKNSFRMCTQNRGYASFFKKIVKLFKPKQSKPPKCDSVKPCPRRSDSKVCVKPRPPQMDFQTAVKCKLEAIEKESCENYVQHMCPKGIEIGYKEKPPFTSDGGQFLEDRLCREMPEKRIEKLEEDHAIKQKKLEDLAELKEIEEMKKRELLMSSPEYKTCVKSKKKLSSYAQSDITLSPRKNDPCAKLESSVQCDLKPENQVNKGKVCGAKVAPCGSAYTAQKATSSTEIRTPSNKAREIVDKIPARPVTRRKDICANARPCLGVKESEVLTPEQKDKCSHTKICPAKKKDETNLRENLKPCAQPMETEEPDPCESTKPCDPPKKHDESDPCAHVKPCQTQNKVEDPCKPSKEEGKYRCGMVVRPCGSKYKPLKPPVEEKEKEECKETDESECGSIDNLKPCPKIDCKPSSCATVEKIEENQCVKEIESCFESKETKPDPCRDTKPCASSKKLKESEHCKDVKSCISQEAKSDPCRNIKPCASSKKLKESEHCKDVKSGVSQEAKSDPCASSKESNRCQHVKPCGSRETELDPCTNTKPEKKDESEDPCKNLKPCTPPEHIEEDPCKIQDKDENKNRCGLIVKPCGRNYKPAKEAKEGECQEIVKEDCGSVEGPTPCPEIDCGSSKEGMESSDTCGNTKEEDPCKGEASQNEEKMLTCSEIKAKDEEEQEAQTGETKITCETKKDDCKKPPKPPSAGGSSCTPCPKGPSPSALGRGIRSDIVKFYSMREQIAGTPSETDIFSAIENFKKSAESKVNVDFDNDDLGGVGLHGEHHVEAHKNLFRQCTRLGPYCDAQQALKYNDSARKIYGVKSGGLNLEFSQLMGIIPKNTQFFTSRTFPNIINQCSYSTRTPKIIIESKKPPLKPRIHYPFCTVQSVFFSEVKGNDGGEVKNDQAPEDPCKVEKKPCPSPAPCCKKQKEQCVMSSEPSKEPKVCRLPKAEEPKVEVKKAKVNPCNFEEAVKAESKHRNFKENMCPTIVRGIEVCPPKKQLCCYSKKEKPTMQGVDECCRGTVGDTKALGCGFCKKFELLNIPPNPKPKPPICKAAPCFTKIPKVCPVAKSSGSCKPSVCKRAEIPKCPKPKFKVEVKAKVKKQPVGAMRCSNAPCYQKKCTKKKPPPPPCPTPIKAPKLEDLPPIKKQSKKCKRVVDEATQKRIEKMCSVPPKRRGDSGVCNVSTCDKDDKKAKESAERKRRQALAREKEYAELKHTEWKATPIKGDNRWCKTPPVERNTKCDKELSKTLVPTTDEKYRSPRYNKFKEDKPGKGSCAKPCPNKHVRKMHSCPHFDQKEPVNVSSGASLKLRRDYFENLASIIGGKSSDDKDDTEV